jgi:hypothetical protein
MPHGPIITDAVKNCIARVYLEHQDWTSYKIHSEVHARLLKSDSQVIPGWPRLSTIQKVLARLREVKAKIYPKLKWLDEPWDVTTITKDEIPPQALPIVLKTAVHFRQTLGRQMTIREIRWAVRLSSVQDLRKLYDFIMNYAEEERLAELTGIVDERRAILDIELYKVLTDKRTDEPVIDADKNSVSRKKRGGG